MVDLAPRGLDKDGERYDMKQTLLEGCGLNRHRLALQQSRLFAEKLRDLLPELANLGGAGCKPE